MVSREPEFSIYGAAWDDARERVARLSSAHTRRAHGAILDYLEGGWALLRPLQVQAERMMRRRDRVAGRESVWVGDFVDLCVTEEFRELVIMCRDSVGASPPEHTGAGAADEAEVVLRALRVLGMAASSPEFPAGLRGAVTGAADGFARWMPGLRPLLVPLERITLGESEPVAVERLRIVD